VGPEDDVECKDWRRTESFEGYSCECFAGYSGEMCEEGCHCSGFHECVIHTDCNTWGVCQEVSYDCVLQVKMVALSAGAGGAVLIVLLFAAIAVCCVKFMPKIQRRTKESYSDSDPNDLPPLAHMFNFMGYAKHDPTHQELVNEGYSEPHRGPAYDTPERPVSDYKPPWYLNAAKRLWREKEPDRYDENPPYQSQEALPPPLRPAYQGFDNQAYTPDYTPEYPPVENLGSAEAGGGGRRLRRIEPTTSGAAVGSQQRLSRMTPANQWPDDYAPEAPVMKLPRTLTPEDSKPIIHSYDDVRRLPRSDDRGNRSGSSDNVRKLPRSDSRSADRSGSSDNVRKLPRSDSRSADRSGSSDNIRKLPRSDGPSGDGPRLPRSQGEGQSRLRRS